MWPGLVLGTILFFTPARSDVVSYEGETMPEEAGFVRFFIYDPERWIEDGWFFQSIDQGGGTGGPYDGDYDRYDYDVSGFAGLPFFVEWRLLTDAPDSEVDFHNGGAAVILNGPGVTYHFNIASGLARLLREYPYPTVYFDIEPGVPHTYRLEVYGGNNFEFQIDGITVESGVPGDAFPAGDSELLFRSRYYLSPHTTQWDYVRFGTIPEPGTGVLLLASAGWLLRRRRRVRR